MCSKLFRGSLKILDVPVFIGILVVGVVLIRNASSIVGDVVKVTADGKVYEYSASVDGTYSVEGCEGTTVFQIQDGQVHILDSACPGKTCVQQGYVSPVVCLPNKVIITVERKSDVSGEFDAVVQ